ncbi:MAG: M14 family metallopeptidase [Acidobacteriota bacterium]|nr:M14 family metallopeptidase [Blastocatellia bacterium]MDW8240219.1 M14 family metallopeptidase [Acidobacteriota bacterium]
MNRMVRYSLIACCLVMVATIAPAQRLVRSPQAVLGFEPGQARRLANWTQIVDYFKMLAQHSPRVQVRELGRSTLGRPLIVAIISSEANLRKLDRLKEIQRMLADPRLVADEEMAERLISEGKIVVAISCSLHSTEIVASQMSLELAYRLASENTAETREILDNTVILLFPSPNPDGIDIVSAWYEKTLGTPYEGSDPPELYHVYTGHDNNRDWFMLTQVETQLVTRLFYREWFPQIVYDVHQMGSNGARMFVPPFYDPANPNIDAMLIRDINKIGSHLASALTAAGFKGILSNAQFDMWWHGGFRTAPYYHNAIGILTEAASARLMSPVEIRAEQLRGHPAGFPNPLMRSINFPDPWPGGLWQPRDILDMELVASRALLLLAARYKRDFMMNVHRVARRAIEAGRTQPPFAYVIPPEQHDPITTARFLTVLMEQGIEVHQARRSFVIEGVRYPAGTFVILMAQPYRACAKALLESQTYPSIPTADGTDQQPYDVAGWTLPMQMGVSVVEVERQFEVDLKRIDSVAPPDIGVEELPGGQAATTWLLRPQTNNAFAVVNELLEPESPIQISRLREDVEIERHVYQRGSFVLTARPRQHEAAREWIAVLASKHEIKIQAVRSIPERAKAEIQRNRIGLYRSWVPSMDEGWTRWVLEQFGFQFETVRDSDIRAGNLNDRFDGIILPDQTPRQILEGHAPGRYPQQYTGGVGISGVQQLKLFVQSGGTLICLGQASDFVLEHFDLPVRNVLAQASRREFFCPGSILGIEVETLHPLGYGMPARSMAVVRDSLAFEATGPPASNAVDVVVRYAKTDVLKSGYLLGEDRIAGRAAMVEVKVGRGRVILIGVAPQHRGQAHGTFKLLFNAIYRAGAASEQGKEARSQP